MATPQPSARRTARTDRVASLVVAFGFSVGLGVATVAIPLLALDVGYDAAAVGFLVATSAAAQLGTRLGLPWLLGWFPDRTLIAVASLLMMSAFVLLLGSTALPIFVAAQLLQGSARAIFWTSSQTHAVRSGGRPVERLVDLNTAGNVGTLIGPTLAGSLAVFGLPFAIAAAAVGAAAAAVGTPLLIRLEAYDRRLSAGTLRLLRRDGVDVACWASVVGGGWWSMVGSYIPVILVGAGIGSQGIGWLITASEGASIAALVALRRLAAERVRPVVWAGGLGAIVSLAAFAIAPADITVYLVLLLAGGAASGAVTALAPALASLAAGPDEQGDVMSVTGTFRAAALLATPAAVGALLSLVALGPAVVIVSGAFGLSALAVGRTSAALAVVRSRR
jgi:MFS family permease